MSDFKNILAYAGVDEGCLSRLELAADLAIQFNAHLTGLHIIPQAVYTPYNAIEFPVDVYDKLQAHEKKITEKLKQTFHNVVANKNINNYHWREFNSTLSEGNQLLLRHAHYQDLILIPQKSHDTEHDNHITPEICLTEGATPTIVTPEATQFSVEHSHIAIAWNAAPQAVRALHAAMPLIKKAKKVYVIMANVEKSFPKHDPINHPEAINLYFKNHNVNIQLHEEKNIKKLKIDDLILNFINDNNVNMLVMGGYSHFRITEALFGGVSHEILTKSPIPVFITH